MERAPATDLMPLQRVSQGSCSRLPTGEGSPGRWVQTCGAGAEALHGSCPAHDREKEETLATYTKN